MTVWAMLQEISKYQEESHQSTLVFPELSVFQEHYELHAKLKMRKFPGVINFTQIWVSWLVVIKLIKSQTTRDTETERLQKCTPETVLDYLSGNKNNN